MATKNKKDDVCVIGVGRYGTAIVEELVEQGVPVYALDQNESALKPLAELTDTAIVNGADLQALKALGIKNFKTVIVGCSENIEIVSALTELKISNIIARAKTRRHQRVLKQIGVHVIINPEIETGKRTALIATNSNLIKYSKDVQEIGNSGVVVGTTTVNNPMYIGKPLKFLDFKRRDINVVLIIRQGISIIPNANTNLKQGDDVTIIGRFTSLNVVIAKLNRK